MTIEERKARIAEIQSQQLALLTRVIEISKKLEKKRVKNNVRAAIDSAISMVALGLEIRMLEAEKQIIISAPLPKFAELRNEKVYQMTPKPISPEEVKALTEKFETDLLIDKSRFGGLSPTEENNRRAIFAAQMNAKSHHGN